MNAEIGKKWVEELRSGKYPQTTGALRKTGEEAGFCCFGVLCELAVKEGVIGEPINNGDTIMDYNGALCFPPVQVRQWASLEIDSESTLAEMNDDRATFAEIAQYIEDYLL